MQTKSRLWAGGGDVSSAWDHISEGVDYDGLHAFQGAGQTSPMASDQRGMLLSRDEARSRGSMGYRTRSARTPSSRNS